MILKCYFSSYNNFKHDSGICYGYLSLRQTNVAILKSNKKNKKNKKKQKKKKWKQKETVHSNYK